MDKSYFVENIEKCESYKDIFELVKKAVEKTIGLRRVGLLLYLKNLPPNIGAYYQVGSNGIVLNKLLVSVMGRSLLSKTEFNSFIFSLLLHEYLHSLGFLDEKTVRKLVYEISMKTFGECHPVVKIALDPPKINIPFLDVKEFGHNDFEIVRDFEKIEHEYIV
ncbi:MAG: hypothetical protein QXL85_03430 [Candidatus Bathyarchaeia archaeon]